MGPLRTTPCVRCGGKADFALLFSEPEKVGGQEKGPAPVPMVWECRACNHIAPVLLAKNTTL